MVPLAVTSTAGWIRRLGGKRWQLLHRLIYVSAIAGRGPLLLAGEVRRAQAPDVRRDGRDAAAVSRGGHGSAEAAGGGAGGGQAGAYDFFRLAGRQVSTRLHSPTLKAVELRSTVCASRKPVKLVVLCHLIL